MSHNASIRLVLYIALALSVTYLFTGCVALTSPGRVRLRDLPPGKVLVADYDATRRQVVCVRHGERLQCCAEPSPDATFEIATKAVASVTYAGVTGSVSPELASRLVELSGRTQTILFLRESSFRLCEQAMAGTLAPHEVKDLYRVVLDAARDFAAGIRAQEERRVVESVQGMTPEEQRIYGDVLKGRQ